MGGHKEKTLALLWSIMFHWHMPKLVDAKRLAREAAIIRKCFAKADAALTALELELVASPRVLALPSPASTNTSIPVRALCR